MHFFSLPFRSIQNSQDLINSCSQSFSAWRVRHDHMFPIQQTSAKKTAPCPSWCVCPGLGTIFKYTLYKAALYLKVPCNAYQLFTCSIMSQKPNTAKPISEIHTPKFGRNSHDMPIPMIPCKKRCVKLSRVFFSGRMGEFFARINVEVFFMQNFCRTVHRRRAAFLYVFTNCYNIIFYIFSKWHKSHNYVFDPFHCIFIER